MRQRIWLHFSARDCLADDLLGLLQRLREELPVGGDAREIGYTDGARSREHLRGAPTCVVRR